MTRSLRLAVRLLRTASLEDRIKLLIKKYPGVDPEIIKEAAEIDPTRESGSYAYLEWIVNRINKGLISWPKDKEEIEKHLESYQSYKKTPRLLKEYDADTDINKYTPEKLRELYNDFHGREYGNLRPGVRVVYKKSPYLVIEIVGGPGVDLDTAIHAACVYAKGTEWCTEKSAQATSYLKKSSLYVIYKNGRKIAQADHEEVQDLEGKDITIEDNEELYSLLIGLGIISQARAYYTSVIDKEGVRLPEEYEQVVMKDPLIASEYAVYHLKKRWPEAETYIMTDSSAAYKYAVRFLKVGERWKEAEPYIMKDPLLAQLYAMNILHHRWQEAEPYIMKDPISAAQYALNVLHQEWPEAEPYIKKDFNAILLYAEMVMRRRWISAEPILKTNKSYWNEYVNSFPRAAEI